MVNQLSEKIVFYHQPERQGGREGERAAEIKLFDFISFYWRGRQGGADLCFERK